MDPGEKVTKQSTELVVSPEGRESNSKKRYQYRKDKT